MLYLIDFGFVVVYLLVSDVAQWVINSNLELYKNWRQYYKWFEFSWVIGAVYFLPEHTITEGCTAFFASLAAKAVNDIIFYGLQKRELLDHLQNGD